MNLTELYTHEYEEFVSDILRLFEIENQQTTKQFRYLKNKISKKIFSKKFSKLFLTKKKSEDISLFNELKDIFDLLVSSNKELEKRIEILNNNLITKENEMLRREEEFEEEIKINQRKQDNYELEISTLGRKISETKIQNESKIQKLNNTIQQKQKEIDELFVKVTLKDSEIDKYKERIQLLENKANSQESELLQIKKEFEFFCNNISKGKGNKIYWNKTLQKTSNNNFMKLWNGVNIKKLLFMYLNDEEIHKIQQTSKKVNLILENDEVLAYIRSDQKTKGRLI